MPAVDLDTADLARVWRGAREVVMAALRAKQGVPLERMMLSAEAQAAIAAFEEVRQRVAALNDHLQAANAAIRLVKEQAAAGNRPALAADLAQPNAAKARHSPAIALRCAAYLEEKLAKAATEVRRHAARQAAADPPSAKAPNYEAA